MPWLITLSDFSDETVMRFVNNTVSVSFNGFIYSAAAFEYTPNAEQLGFSGGGKLNIAVTDNEIIDLIESKTRIKLSVVGCLLSNGAVSEIKTFSSSYGSVSWNAKKASFIFDRDDRLDMTFPALIFSNYNARGI